MTLRITLPLLVVALLGGPAAWATDLDDQDAWMIQESAQSSMETAKTNQPTEWVNPDTGSTGSITPVATYQQDDGTYCREYIQTVTIAGEEQQAYGTACRQPDGSWEVQKSEPVTDQVAATQAPTVVYRDRVVYQPTPAPTYGYPVIWPFALSVGIGFGFYSDDWYAYFGAPYFGFASYGGYRYGYWRPGTWWPGYRPAYYRGGRHWHGKHGHGNHGYRNYGYGPAHRYPQWRGYSGDNRYRGAPQRAANHRGGGRSYGHGPQGGGGGGGRGGYRR